MHGTLETPAPPGSIDGFYASPCGQVAAEILRDRLRAFWPELGGQCVLGMGHAAPFLPLWQETAYRCLTATPGALAPAAGPNACLVREDRLPFPDLSFDRILIIHGLEAAENARSLLREVWRVLKDDGRLLVVAPNRHGLWAHVESTPFGHGTPYSPLQIASLLAASLFRPERRDVALFVPPTDWRLILRGWPVWEQVGHAVATNLAGVTLTEAVKDAYAALPITAPARRQVVTAEQV
ncbi:MAG TPA: methyltransferase domain-containing protein [Acetobacteraceae bacterium]|nr:methyltransferase domain-containing protein [Acetobacteraceae bacterium]